MKFKTDENLPVEAAAALRAAGYDATSVLEQQLGGRPDPRIGDVCRHEGRVLVTLDMDFADIRTYPPGDHPGIIVLRLERQSRPQVLHYLARVIRALATASCERQLWLVELERIRVRS